MVGVFEFQPGREVGMIVQLHVPSFHRRCFVALSTQSVCISIYDEIWGARIK